MPDVFWDFFWCNRHLLHRIPAIAASVLQDLAKKKKTHCWYFPHAPYFWP